MSAKLPASERVRNKNNYGLYCINFFGSGLNSIKDEFKRQVRNGLRQTVFLLDLQELQTELTQKPRSTKINTALKGDVNGHLINSIIQLTQEFRKQYEMQTKKISEELKFNLCEYWLKQSSENLHGKDKSNTLITTSSPKGSKSKITCPNSLQPKEHNRVGRPTLLSKIKFIKDEPTLGKLYIIILGEMNKDFYTDLLRRHLPLEGIISFIPIESNYDIMLGNNKLRNFIMATLETIKSSIYELRQEVTMKPVGLFTHELPVISNCLATKHCREIFDQLSWSIYDIDMLQKQYEAYYFKPFQVTDVDIPAGVDLTKFYYLAESLNIEGPFQKSLLPASDADLASIASYLRSLINACDLHKDSMEESQQTIYTDNFRYSTITSISKYNRLVVAESNKLLANMLQYADISKFDSIYLCCLDYNIFRQYVLLPAQQAVNEEPAQMETTTCPLTLPQYVKYYVNKDCACQRLTELLNEYDEYQVREIAPGYKLHSFKSNLNVLHEDEGTYIIPTRLCFRDFTLFQIEEFTKNLQTPEPKTDSTSDIHNLENKEKTMNLDEKLFIRPNALKARNQLQEEKTKSDDKIRKIESRSNRSKNGKRISFTKEITNTKESLGLPPDHHLLKGYNLEDTLQEVKCKNTKYNNQHGSVKLYEEKWCYQDMNEQLSLSINNATVFFSRPRGQLTGISNNIHLITKNNISIRMLNDPNECSKIVMNYPNGLSVFHHEGYCEEIWYGKQTHHSEQRRIFTNGAIIVFFKANDLIMIMRYNGEVYMLYQYELLEEEEEQEFINNLADVEEKSSEFKEQNAPSQSLFVKQRAANKQSSILSITNTNKLRHSLKDLSELSIKGSTVTKMTIYDLKFSVNYQLNFLNSLCSKYDLTYLHLIITTSQGKRMNLTNKGDIFEGRQCSIHEWHDYFANESYCERSDGVKMIWSKDAFKCFHQDGTVFTTTIEEDFAGSYVDEFESQISQSSSHHSSQQRIDNEGISAIKTIKRELDQYLTLQQSIHGKMSSTFGLSTNTISETAEEYIPTDIRFIQYKCKGWLMHHSNYAAVYLRTPKMSSMPAKMEIFAVDNVRVYTNIEQDYKHYSHEYGTLPSEYDFMDQKMEGNLTVNVWIGNDLHVKADNVACEINAVVRPTTVDTNIKCDSLTLSLKYTDCIRDAFKYLVNKIASIEDSSEEQLQELYFIEKTNSDSSTRGFEFFTSLPVISNYKYRISNNITELKPVKSINESLIYTCEGHNEDLNKFPRFKQQQKGKTCYNLKDEFPRLLTANIYIEIPKQLLTLDNVTKFLEPFENIHFKKLRPKFKDVLNYYIKPKQQFYLKILSSIKNWKKRHWEHKRRVFTEKQRLGLYNAMIKHKMYPNYWLFSETYGSKVRHIEFFDFMKNKCGYKDADEKRQV